MNDKTANVETAQVLAKTIKQYIAAGNFDAAVKDILAAMVKFPHSAVPHNLMGILMEHENNHYLAMKHFRAACALDPTFRPARLNLDKYGSFGDGRLRCDVYDDSDCQPDGSSKYNALLGGTVS